MSEKKWTPGPWFIDKDFDVVVDRCSVMLGSMAIRSDETSKANAHLTAAAPDLYEALYDIVMNDNIDRYQALAALAKARGEK